MLTSYEIHVAAPVDVVFDTAADVGAMPQFTLDVEAMVFLTPPPLALRSQVQDTRKLMGVRRTQVIDIPLYEHPTRSVAGFTIYGRSCRWWLRW